MSAGLTTLLMFLSMLVGLTLGLPIAWCLGGVGVIFSLILWGSSSLYIYQSQVLGTTQTIVLIAIPLFVLMANILETSGIADALYDTMHKWMGGFRGGLAIGTVLICTLFAAMAGVSAAATVTMGVIALPSMLKRGYDKSIAMGCIMAGGALGVLIPPSVMMVVYSVVAGESVGKMFLGGFLPGFLLSGLFMVYIGIRCFFNPSLGPAVPKAERHGWKDKILSLRSIVLPFMLVIFVLGSMFTGMATPTEASAMGVLGAILSAAVYQRLTWSALKDATYRSLRLTVVVLWIYIGATAFTSVYQALGAPQLMQQIVANLDVNRWFVLISMQIVFFILGCFLDPSGIILICTPIFVPIIKMLGFDSLWFGILFVVNMEMAYLTPPFGFNLFYMKSVAPQGITLIDIYRSITPFVLLQALGLVLCIVFPQIPLYLPHALMGA